MITVGVGGGNGGGELDLGVRRMGPVSEQLYRAKLLYRRGGAGQWGCGRHLFD